MNYFKVVCAALFLLFNTALFADTTAVETILFDGSQSTQEINLSTEKTKTRYRTVTVPRTCYRTEWRRSCHQVPGQCTPVCDRFGNCSSRCTPPRRVCQSTPIQIPYTCYQQERRAYQVHDYYVETNAKFEFVSDDLVDYTQEAITLKVNGDKESLSAQGSKNYIIYLEKKQRSESRSAGVKNIELTYRVKFISTQKIKDVIANDYQNFSLRRGVVNFDLGPGFNMSEYSVEVKVFVNRRLWRDRLIFSEYLRENEVKVNDDGNKSNVTINLNGLRGLRVPSNLRLIVKTEYILNQDMVLNPNDIDLSIYTNRVYR